MASTQTLDSLHDTFGCRNVLQSVVRQARYPTRLRENPLVITEPAGFSVKVMGHRNNPLHHSQVRGSRSYVHLAMTMTCVKRRQEQALEQYAVQQNF